MTGLSPAPQSLASSSEPLIRSPHTCTALLSTSDNNFNLPENFDDDDNDDDGTTNGKEDQSENYDMTIELNPERRRRALVVGGGPVGALTALSLNKRGWDVELWEARDDPRGRTIAMTNLRSINMNISSRGLAALASVDPALAELLLNESIPMPSRLIHHLDGRREAQLYDPLRGQCSNSISRSVLNQRLVEALPKSIQCRFNTKLVRVDWVNNIAYGRETRPGAALGTEQTSGLAEGSIESQFDLILGADGSWSQVRSQMMRASRIDFAQSFIAHAYVELHMPPLNGEWAMPPNHLHIWPRRRFMLIALPNKDKSFTLTLFAPFEEIAALETRSDAEAFFASEFADAYKIVGSRMVDDFMSNPRGNLVTISCKPGTYKDRCALLGDAWHSMVPFYGQGLNCGLEDVRVLGSYLDRFGIGPTTANKPGQLDGRLEECLATYASERSADLDAICQLAMDNYTEMRSSVLNPLYHLRRAVDYALTRLIPSQPASLDSPEPFPTKTVRGWTALYDMVTFRPDIGYAEARRREAWQKHAVHSAAYAGLAAVVGAGLFAARHFHSRR